MEKIKDFTINLVYLEEDGWRWRLEELVENKGGVALETGGLSEFAQSLGGLELIANGHWTFYASTDHHDLENIVVFLLESLICFQVMPDEIVQSFGSLWQEGGRPRLSHVSGAVLELAREPGVQNLIRIYYRPAPNSVSKSRNNFFFSNLFMKKSLWIDASLIALDEYFRVAHFIHKSGGGAEEDSREWAWVNAWQQFRAVHPIG